MRRPAALLLTLLAAAALPAAKPMPPGDGPSGGAQDDARQRWRGQAVAICVDELHAVPDLGPDDLESICGCAADRFLDGNGPAPLPQIARDQFPQAMQSRMLACTARIRPESASAVARLDIAVRQAPPPETQAPPTEAKPVGDEGLAAPASSDGGNDGGFWAWLRSIGLPAWLTGASGLWWIAIGIFVFGLLILKIRSRDPRRDLSAPPSSLRRGMPAARPRRPDLPR
jgi:hypothetical protein